MAKRQPKLGASPRGDRTPQQGADPDEDRDSFLSYRLALLDLDDKCQWSWRCLSAEKVAYVHGKLREFERKTFGELLRQKGTAPIPSSSLCKEARARLQTLSLDDLDPIWHLRLSGKERIWGKLEGNVFYPVWWDPEHEICPSKKKHT